MRWKCKPTPQEFDRRIITRFYLFPSCIEGTWVWLEHLTLIEEYTCHWDYYSWDIKEVLNEPIKS